MTWREVRVHAFKNALDQCEYKLFQPKFQLVSSIHFAGLLTRILTLKHVFKISTSKDIYLVAMQGDLSCIPWIYFKSLILKAKSDMEDFRVIVCWFPPASAFFVWRCSFICFYLYGMIFTLSESFHSSTHPRMHSFLIPPSSVWFTCSRDKWERTRFSLIRIREYYYTVLTDFIEWLVQLRLIQYGCIDKYWSW